MTTQTTSTKHFSNTGFRRFTPAMFMATEQLEALRLASLQAQKTGSPIKYPTKWQIQEDFEEAATCLKLHHTYTRFVKCLIKETRPCDWEGNNPLICAPSNRHLAARLGIGESQIKRLIRKAAEDGYLICRDSPIGKRFLKRNRKTGLIESGYGFDLSPLKLRYPEFRQIINNHWEQRREAEKSRSHIFTLQKNIKILLGTIEDIDLYTEEDQTLFEKVTQLAKLKNTELDLKILHPIESELCSIYTSLKRRISTYSRKGTGTRPSTCTPNTSTYNPLNLYVEKENKIIIQPDNQSQIHSIENQKHDFAQEENKPEKPPIKRTMNPLNGYIVMPYLILKISMMFRNAVPEKRLSTLHYTQQDIIEAAYYLCNHLNIDQELWGQACILMGKYTAAICVAIITAKWERGKIRNGGGVMRAMINRFQTGELHLDKSLYGLKDLIKKENHNNTFLN